MGLNKSASSYFSVVGQEALLIFTRISPLSSPSSFPSSLPPSLTSLPVQQKPIFKAVQDGLTDAQVLLLIAIIRSTLDSGR